MSLEDLSDAARRDDAQHEAELGEQLAVIADELAQRYGWTEARLVAKLRDALADLGAHDAVQSARIRAIRSELFPPGDRAEGPE
jgi:hypothetical protein